MENCKGGGTYDIMVVGCDNVKKTWKNILLIFLFSLFLSLSLFQNPFHAGHDTKYHYANVLAIEELMEKGKADSLIVDHVANGLGYGTRIFYPPLSHATTVFVSQVVATLNLDTRDAFKFVHLFTFFFSGVTMYFLALKFSGKKILALFSSLFYMAMPYFLSDIYIRCALAESFMFIFIPLILLSFIYLLEGDKKHFYPCFVIGYVGGILSHFTLMIYATFLFGIFLLIYRKRFFQKEIFLTFLKASGVVLCLCLFFFVPMLTHKILGNYAVFKEGYMAQGIWHSGLSLFDYLNPFDRTDPNDVDMYLPLIVSILLIFTIYFREKIAFPKYSKGLLIFGLLAFWMSTILFPWDFLPLTFRMIQFPWRMETFVVVIVSLFAPLCLTVIPKRLPLIYTLIVLGLLSGTYLTIHFPSDNLVESEDNVWWNGGMGWQREYLPVSALYNLNYYNNRTQEVIALDNTSVKIETIFNDMPDLSIQVVGVKEEAEIEFPRIFYYGYRLVDEEGNEIPLYENSKGFLTANIKKDGTYTLSYRGFPISRMISCGGLLLFSGIYLYKVKKERY